MQARFASNMDAARQLAAAVGMAGSSVLQPGPPADAAADDDASGWLQGLSIARGGTGQGGSDAAAGRGVQQQLPDPQEAARRILHELGELLRGCLVCGHALGVPAACRHKFPA